jgi:hypothetical protein
MHAAGEAAKWALRFAMPQSSLRECLDAYIPVSSSLPLWREELGLDSDESVRDCREGASCV